MRDNGYDDELTLGKKARRVGRDYEDNLTYKEVYKIPIGKRVTNLKLIKSKTKTQINGKDNTLTIIGTQKNVKKAIGEISKALVNTQTKPQKKTVAEKVQEEFLGFAIPVSKSKDLTDDSLYQIMDQTQTRITYKNHSKDHLWFTITGKNTNVKKACALFEDILSYNPMKNKYSNNENQTTRIRSIKVPFEVKEILMSRDTLYSIMTESGAEIKLASKDRKKGSTIFYIFLFHKFVNP